MYLFNNIIFLEKDNGTYVGPPKNEQVGNSVGL